MEHEYIIAHADKCVLKISGLKVKGLNTAQLEEILGNKLKAFVRVIGVTGENIEMDVYDAEPDQIRRSADGLIESLVLAEGINVTDLTKLSCSEKIIEVDYNDIPDEPLSDCAMERWIRKRHPEAEAIQRAAKEAETEARKAAGLGAHPDPRA